jgi:ABC-type multidrug transport system fused ATPase/permease subunit
MRNIYSKLDRLLSKRAKLILVILVLLSFVGACLETIGVTVILPYISFLSDPDYSIPDKYSFFLPNLAVENRFIFLTYVSAAILLVYLLKNIYIYALGIIKREYILREWNKTTCKVLDNYLSKPYLFYLSNNVNDISNRINNYTSKAFLLLGVLIDILSEIMVLMLLLVFLLFMDIRLTLIFGSVFVAFVVISKKVISRKIYQVGKVSNEVYSDMLKLVTEAVYGIQDIKLLKRERMVCDNYGKLARVNKQAEIRKMQLSTAPRHVLEIVSVAVLLLIVWFSFKTDNSGLSIAVISTASVALVRIMPSVSRLNRYISEMNYYLPALNDMCDDIFFQEGKAQPKSTTALVFGKEIVFKNVYFAYNDDDIILEDINFKITKGSRVGIMGASGGGKSTMANLLLGMLEPSQGGILVDGIDIRENLNSWYSLISYIPQSIFLLDGSILENIVFMRDIDIDKVWLALEKVRLKEFVSNMKDGLNTRIGDRGIRLSGGQRQRLGIARALYNDTQIFIFDEPTSSLDTSLESEVMDAIYSLEDKTIVIIAHRLDTLKECDIIYEVKDHQLVI